MSRVPGEEGFDPNLHANLTRDSVFSQQPTRGVQEPTGINAYQVLRQTNHAQAVNNLFLTFQAANKLSNEDSRPIELEEPSPELESFPELPGLKADKTILGLGFQARQFNDWKNRAVKQQQQHAREPEIIPLQTKALFPTPRNGDPGNAYPSRESHVQAVVNGNGVSSAVGPQEFNIEHRSPPEAKKGSEFQS